MDDLISGSMNYDKDDYDNNNQTIEEEDLFFGLGECDFNFDNEDTPEEGTEDIEDDIEDGMVILYDNDPEIDLMENSKNYKDIYNTTEDEEYTQEDDIRLLERLPDKFRLNWYPELPDYMDSITLVERDPDYDEEDRDDFEYDYDYEEEEAKEEAEEEDDSGLFDLDIDLDLDLSDEE